MKPPPSGVIGRPRGLMDKASDFGSEDWGFESLRGHIFITYGNVFYELFQGQGVPVINAYNFSQLTIYVIQ